MAMGVDMVVAAALPRDSKTEEGVWSLDSGLTLTLSCLLGQNPFYYTRQTVVFREFRLHYS